jgi:hypothetical protein
MLFLERNVIDDASKRFIIFLQGSYDEEDRLCITDLVSVRKRNTE